MKFRTFTRHIREAVKNIFRNGWMSVASIAAVTITLVLVAAFLAVILNLNRIAENVEEDILVQVMIDRISTDAEIEELGEGLQELPEVSDVSFISKDEVLQDLITGFGEHGKSMELMEQDNPLNHEYRVKTKNPRDVEAIAGQAEEMPHVANVVYGKDTTDKLFSFNTYARVIGIILIVSLLFTAIFLISNTIKLTIMARSDEIGIMRLVGATNSFIRWPFFIEGLMIGFLGSIVPTATILIGYRLIDGDKLKEIMGILELLPYNPFAFQLTGLVVALGVVIGGWGSVMSIRKFLKV